MSGHSQSIETRGIETRASSLVGLSAALLWLGVAVGCAGQADPEIAGVPVEICGDGLDNDNNGLVDCDDPACHAACQQQASPTSQQRVDPPWPSCAIQSGDRSHTPVDIIWVVDSSYSMQDEMARIQENMNRFVDYLTGIKLDVRVVVLGGQQICVPQPLGGPDCSDTERYRHLNEYVGSHDSLIQIVDLYDRYSDFIRPRGRKVIIATTDDDSEVGASWFQQAVAGLDPGFPDGFVFHSIVSFGSHPRGCLTGAAPGHVYLELTEQTQGMMLPICETDWSRIFDQLSANVVQMVELPCAYSVPDLPAEQTLNTDQIQVSTNSADGRWANPPRRHSPAECDQGGWYFDASSSTVQLCPVTCHDQQLRQVEVLFGCNGAID